MTLLSKNNCPVSQPVVEQFDHDFAWEIPQLNTEEKTGSKISSGLSKAVNTSMSVKSNQDSIKLIEEKYYRLENLSLSADRADGNSPHCEAEGKVSQQGTEDLKVVTTLREVLPKQPITTVVKVRELDYHELENINDDVWILDIVNNGYKIEFDVVPQEESKTEIFRLVNNVKAEKWKTDKTHPNKFWIEKDASLEVRLPQYQDLVTLPHTGECHPLRKRLNLTVCIVSGNRLLREDFQNHLQMLSLHLGHVGDHQQSSNINILGENSLFGVFKGRPIPFNHLKRM
ncbi:unnamed protein product [Mytilus coruscus]|uniref:Uncharacterized protein n=1 Tax=Mytilus coruscus TaxID=42192 RepID=A0A6J8BZZ7_MYTCO|nr:unnamed protein product [Mytilus coruscus]